MHLKKALAVVIIRLLCMSLLPSLTLASPEWSREKPSSTVTLDERADTAKLAPNGNAAVDLGFI